MRVLESTGVKFDWDVFTVGEAAIGKYGTPLPEETIESIRKNKVALKGPVTTPIGTGFRSVNVALRKKLDLYACLRPCKSYKGVITTPYRDVDLVIVRENTEDLYIGIEFAKDSAEAAQLYDLIKKSFKDPCAKMPATASRPSPSLAPAASSNTPSTMPANISARRSRRFPRPTS